MLHPADRSTRIPRDLHMTRVCGSPRQLRSLRSDHGLAAARGLASLPLSRWLRCRSRAGLAAAREMASLPLDERLAAARQMLDFTMPNSIPRASASTARLLQLCAGYFVSYVLTGVLVKYFTVVRQPKLTELGYLFNNTLGSSIACLGIVLALGWAVRLAATSNRMVRWGPFRVPAEVAYIVPSGVCTAIVIPTTTLMYSLPLSVMVAMVLMRASVIVISRIVDEVQIRQRILTKRVFAEENWAVVFALLAVATNLLLLPLAAALEHRGVVVPKWLGITGSAARGAFDFLHDPTAMTILGAYIVAYAARIYIMNFYKN